jgi:predicted Zn-dependent protease with MMP-like domain
VTEAISELHPTLQEYLKNVAIMLEEVPDDDILRQYDPPASPLELLGYFSGHSLMERSENDPWSGLPGTIVLYRRNLERHARSHEELVHELRITLFHEVGHFLGLDEEDLEERGLD